MDVVTTGEIELGAIVVDMDEFWDQEERIGEFASGGCSCKYGPEESLRQGLFSTTQDTGMHYECRELSQEELNINLKSVYNVIHGDYYMTVDIHGTCTYIQETIILLCFMKV